MRVVLQIQTMKKPEGVNLKKLFFNDEGHAKNPN